MKIIRGLEQIPKLHNAVITIGSFDGIHLGHQKIFDRIKSIARQINGVSVIITFHPHPRQVIYPKDKTLQLITPIEEKKELLEDLDIDYCLILPFTIEFSQLNPREYIDNFLIKTINPAYIVIGYDHRFGLNREGNFDLLKQYADKGLFQLVKIEKQEMDDIAISSTKIRQAIQHGYVEKANELLGHTFSLWGKVTSGAQLGREMDYPTANVVLDSALKIMPKDGIYAAETVINDKSIPSMVYIGDRPTIEDQVSNSKTIESHLLDFKGDLYDQSVAIRLLKFIRNDEKYDSLEELKAAISNDEVSIRSFFEERPKPIPVSKVNIAILNYNGSHYLESYLPFLHGSHSEGETITVIDNSSTDDSKKLIKDWFPEIQLVELEENYGFAKGYNVGLTDAKEPYLVLLNSDVEVTEGWLDPIIQLMDSDSSIGIVQPKIRSLENKNEFEYAGAAGGYLDIAGYPFCRGRIFDELEKDKGQYDDNQEIFWASGAAFVIRKSLWDGLAGFDENYFAHHEEIDLCWRAKRAGYKVMICGQSAVYHLGGGTLAYDNVKKIFLNFRNNLFTIIKNNGLIKLLWLIPLRMCLDFVALFKFLLSNKASAAWSVVRAYLDVLLNSPRTLRSKRDDKERIRRVSIGSFRKQGYYSKSIVVAHFLKGIDKFKDLKF